MFFLDTSAIAKRYLAETGSTRVQELTVSTSENIILISEIAITEMWSLLSRRVREGLALEVARSVRLTFLLHMRNDYQVIMLSRRGLLKAGRLTEKHLLRTLDAIHLASALEARDILTTPITFVSSDRVQLSSAAAEGLAVENPNTYE